MSNTAAPSGWKGAEGCRRKQPGIDAAHAGGPLNRKSSPLLCHEPGAGGDGNPDRQNAPFFAKNDIIIRQIKNAEPARAENSSGYSRKKLTKNISEKGMPRQQSRQSPGPASRTAKNLAQYDDHQQIESYTSMLLNQRNLEKALLQKQAMNTAAGGVLQFNAQAAGQALAQPGRVQRREADAEDERYLKIDSLYNPKVQICDFSVQMPRGGEQNSASA